MAHRLVRNYHYTITNAATTLVVASRCGSRQKEEKEGAKERDEVVTERERESQDSEASIKRFLC